MDILEFLETHAWSYDYISEKHIKMDINYQERELMGNLDKHRININLKKSRQVGLTSLYVLYMSYHIIYGEDKQTLFYSSYRHDISCRFIDSVKRFLKMYGFAHLITHESKNELRFANGTKLRGVGSNPDAFCGYSPDVLIIDEAAIIKDFDDVLKTIMPSLNIGGRIIIGSSPNGYNKFKDIWDNDEFFNKSSLHWSGTKRFDIEWYDRMCNMLNQDSRQIAQELDGVFLEPLVIDKEVRIELPIDLYKKVSENLIASNTSIDDYLRKLIEADLIRH